MRPRAVSGPLVSADQLANFGSADAPFILDIRGKAVKDGYIPGAISVSYREFRGPSTNPGQLVTDAHLTNLFQRLGLTTDKPTVITYQGKNETDFGAAARVYWTQIGRYQTSSHFEWRNERLDKRCKSAG